MGIFERSLSKKKGIHRLLSLMKELIYANLSLERDKAMKKYIHDVMQIANEIAEIEKNYKLKNSIIMTFILNDLFSQYRYLIINLKSQLGFISL